MLTNEYSDYFHFAYTVSEHEMNVLCYKAKFGIIGPFLRLTSELNLLTQFLRTQSMVRLLVQRYTVFYNNMVIIDNTTLPMRLVIIDYPSNEI